MVARHSRSTTLNSEPRTLNPMTFLLTNDDGIEAAGLAALQAAAQSIGSRVIVVAPAEEQSMCGHRVTTRSAIRVEERGPDRWTVHGTPADCVRVALFGLNLEPDWVLSGVNHGGNMGQDLYISGTVAAVREATYHGVKAMAFSHYIIGGIDFDWPRISRWTAQMMRQLLAEPLPRNHFWNTNFPHLPPGDFELPEVVRTSACRSPLNVTFAPAPDGLLYTARYAERPQDEDSDVHACFGGRVSVSTIGV